MDEPALNWGYSTLTAYGRTWIGRALNWSIKSWEVCRPALFLYNWPAPASFPHLVLFCSCSCSPSCCSSPQLPTSPAGLLGLTLPPLPMPFPCSHTPTLPNFPSQLPWQPMYWEFLISTHHLPMLPIPLPCYLLLASAADPE